MVAHIFCTLIQSLFLIIGICTLLINHCLAHPTFAVSFQPNGTWSTEHWMRYNKKISGVGSDFTFCQWIRIRYFSTDISSIWAYCYLHNDTQTALPCWHLFMEADKNSAGRKVNLVARSPHWYVEAPSLKYRHRQWNHICFVYSFDKQIGMP